MHVSAIAYHSLTGLRIVDHLEKRGLFSDFQYGFRSSRSTADLLTVVSDRVVRAFIRSVATLAVAFNISRAFYRVWHAALLHKLKSYVEFHVRCLALFLLFSVIDSFEWFWMGSLHKNNQLMLEFFKAPHFSYYTLMTFMMMLSINLNLIYEALWTG